MHAKNQGAFSSSIATKSIPKIFAMYINEADRITKNAKELWAQVSCCDRQDEPWSNAK